MHEICLAEYTGERTYWDKDHVYQANKRSKDFNLLLAAYEHWTAGMVLAEDSRSSQGQACTLYVRVTSSLLLQHMTRHVAKKQAGADGMLYQGNQCSQMCKSCSKYLLKISDGPQGHYIGLCHFSCSDLISATLTV